MYLKWDEKTIDHLDDQTIGSYYNQGYLFGRQGKGAMYQTRSIRIDLKQFTLSSENKRILKKTEELLLSIVNLPYPEYHWSIGKLAKDFYTTKFGDGTFSANKIKELITNPEKSNFNTLFVYSLASVIPNGREESLSKKQTNKDPSSTDASLGIARPIGYCICLQTKNILHYCYPFYSLLNIGMGMMLKAVLWAQENGKRYIYLGSAQRPSDTYKLQFAGLEWFDGKEWKRDVDELKQLLV